LTRAQSIRVALAHLAIVVAIALVLSLGSGCTFEVEHTAHGYHVSAGTVVLVLLTLAAIVAFCEWMERP
jgi:uncharacterized membrane protein